MANYSKSTNFAVKDSLTTGDPNKIVSGVEIDTEFNSLASMSSTKTDKVGGATAGNLATLTASGGIQDSGSAVSDLYGTEDLKTDLNVTGETPLYAVRTWVNFKGTTSPIQINNSGNVSSITDVGTGQYQINFDENFEDDTYSVVSTSSQVDRLPTLSTRSTSSILIRTFNIDPVDLRDAGLVNVIIVR